MAWAYQGLKPQRTKAGYSPAIVFHHPVKIIHRPQHLAPYTVLYFFSASLARRLMSINIQSKHDKKRTIKIFFEILFWH